MQKIYIVGHGKWVPQNGWVKVPPSVNITFYSNIYTALQNPAVWEILDGTAKWEAPPSTFKPGQWIENQTLSFNSMVHCSNYDEHAALNKDELGNPNKAKFLYICKEGKRTTLAEIFKSYQDQIVNDGGWNLHWSCCRAVVKADQIAYNENPFMSIVPLTRVKAGGVREAMPDPARATGMHTPNKDLVTCISRPITRPETTSAPPSGSSKGKTREAAF